jgi:hypothetical protein
MKKLVLFAIIGPLVGAVPADAQHHNHAMSAMSHDHRNQTALPKEGGQSAFEAISEVVDLLSADRTTDWSKANVDRLRDHLVDMDNVTLHSRVRSTSLPRGARFEISGEGPVIESIQRMTRSHASMSSETPGIHTIVEPTANGATMTVTADMVADAQKIRALGFFGAMTAGVHHQLHHLMMAKGEMRH